MNYTPDMSRESVDRAIYHALLIWSYPSQLRFRQANDLEHPDIEFLFAQGYHKDGYQFDGKGSVLAHAFYPEEYLGGDVHYDEDEDWTAYRENEYGSSKDSFLKNLKEYFYLSISSGSLFCHCS